MSIFLVLKVIFSEDVLAPLDLTLFSQSVSDILKLSLLRHLQACCTNVLDGLGFASIVNSGSS